jgi:hypothetical protein
MGGDLGAFYHGVLFLLHFLTMILYAGAEESGLSGRVQSLQPLTPGGKPSQSVVHSWVATAGRFQDNDLILLIGK